MKAFAVVGHPLEHSLSPVLFNTGFKALGLDYTYTKKDILLSDLKTLINEVREGKYSGLSITVPYKEACVQFLDNLTPEAKAIGAVNTVYMSKGELIGTNTDWWGFKKALTQHANTDNKTILIYGAGGVARACLYALKDSKSNVFLTNRTEIKGKVLAQEFEVKFVSKNHLPDADIFINATSVSLHGTDELLVSLDWLKKVSIVFDLMYDSTALVSAAKKLGLLTIDAKEMLLYQATKQFEIFTGRQAPTEVMARSIGI